MAQSLIFYDLSVTPKSKLWFTLCINEGSPPPHLLKLVINSNQSRLHVYFWLDIWDNHLIRNIITNWLFAISVLIPKDSRLINLTAKVHPHGLLDMGQDNHLCCHNEIGEFLAKLKDFFFFLENVECNLNLNCLNRAST